MLTETPKIIPVLPDKLKAYVVSRLSILLFEKAIPAFIPNLMEEVRWENAVTGVQINRIV